MATKIYNNHLYNLIYNANRYYTIDVYLALVHISVQFKDENDKSHFLIQTGDSRRKSLISVLNNFLDIERQTIVNCLGEIESLGLLVYSENYDGWEISDMGEMFKRKDELEDPELKLDGYTNLKDILLSDEFKTLRLREKKLLLYMCHLQDTKGANKFAAIYKCDIVINVLNEKSIWRKILRTKSKYYALSVIKEFKEKLKNSIEDVSKKCKGSKFKPKTILKFMFYFNVPKIKKNEKVDLWTKQRYFKEIQLIEEYMGILDVTLPEKKKYQLAHSIGCLKWELKELVVRNIINKYRSVQVHKDSKDISSLPAFTAAVIKRIKEEYNAYLDSKKVIAEN